MESTHQKKQNSIYDNLALFSLIAGIVGLTSCCYPPVQLILGSTALILAFLSRNQKALTVPSIIGIITGTISLLLSLLLFLQYVWVMNLMEDPANAAMVKEFYRQTEELMNQWMPAQPQ